MFLSPNLPSNSAGREGGAMEIEIKAGKGVARRAEIDTRAPFRSVKEAVVLFGERVLSPKVYSNKLEKVKATESKRGNTISCLSSITSELEKARQCLECAREENLKMETSLTFLKEELEKTKMELQLLKGREYTTEKELGTTEVIHSEIEQLKFVEDTTEVKVETPKISEGIDFQITRSVSFAEPSSLTRVLRSEGQVLERQFSANNESARRKRKKPFLSLIGRIFPKKWGYL